MRAIQCRLTSSWSDIKGLAVDPLFLGMGMNVRIVDLVLGLTSRGRGLEGSQRHSCMQWVIMRPRDGGSRTARLAAAALVPSRIVRGAMLLLMMMGGWRNGLELGRVKCMLVGVVLNL